MRKYVFCVAAAVGGMASVWAAGGSIADKPQGFRFFNQHLTVKPYVALSYTYDTNVDTTHDAVDDSIFCINPGVDFQWRDERWSLAGTLWYRWNAYMDHSDDLGENSYGESLSYTWSSSKPNERGWTLMLGERYAFINQSDDLTDGGRGIWRDRESLNVSGALERRFTDRWHADVMMQYDSIDYENEEKRYAPLYGWSSRSVGLEAGYAASPWTDLLVSGGFSDFTQDGSYGWQRYDNDSHSWTIQAGVGTRATERISYRALLGASWLSYGGQSNCDCGWTYSLSANWRITRQLQFSMLGSSYYQPSERSLGQAMQVYALSGGLSYLTLGDRMTLSANIAFRHEETAFNDYYLTYRNDYDEDILSARLGANYTLNRWASLFAYLIWEENWCEKIEAYDYSRFRGTIGVRFHY